MTLTIKHKFPDYNTFIRSGGKYAMHQIAQTTVDMVSWECKAQKIRPVKAAHISFKWIEKNRLRDKDNIAFAKKFILDGLQRAGVLTNDGWNQILSLHDEFETGKEYGVIVTIREV